MKTTTDVSELSIDNLLKECVNVGKITDEELKKIHNVIGYDKQNMNQNNSIIPAGPIGQSQESQDISVLEIESSNLPSKQGYAQAWERLSNRLESLDTLNQEIVFTNESMNPYITSLQTSQNSPEVNLNISQNLFSMGDMRQAILASEANVQKNSEYSEGQ